MDKVLKKLKAGTNEQSALENLKDRSLNEIDWLHDKNLLFKWNALQSTPNKVRQFTFVQKSGIVTLCQKVRQMPKWAYIKHDQDITEDGIHYHFYVEFPNPRSFVAVANDLEIPVTSLQKVLNKRGILEYLTHENQPEKHHYNRDEIVTNMDLETEVAPQEIEPLTLYLDYKAMRCGEMSDIDFYKKYSMYISRHSISQQLQVAERIYNASSLGEERANLSPFRVPSSKSSPPPC